MSGSLVTCDSSVLIAALRPTQEGHEVCLEAVRSVTAVPVQVLLEVYGVLTRLPGRQRVPAQPLARELARLAWQPLQLPADAHAAMLLKLAEAGLTGGAVYDAQIAMTAKHHGYVLLSRDRRAARTYEVIGAAYQLVGE